MSMTIDFQKFVNCSEFQSIIYPKMKQYLMSDMKDLIKTETHDMKKDIRYNSIDIQKINRTLALLVEENNNLKEKLNSQLQPTCSCSSSSPWKGHMDGNIGDF